MLRQKQILDIASYAGKIMLTNGAEIYRVEDTISRICQAYGMKYVQSIVTPTGIFISVDDGDDSETVIRRITRRGLNLKKISEINDFSRKLQDEKLNYSTAITELEGISYGEAEFNLLGAILISSIGASMNVIVMQGSFLNLVPALIACLSAQMLIKFLRFLKDINFVPELIAGFIAGSISLLFYNLKIGDSLSLIIVSAILPFVPGVSLTNSIRDAVTGDLISANSRAVEVVLIAISLAVGVAISLGVFYV